MKKKLRIVYNSPVVLTFILVCFIATIAGVLTKNNSTALLFSTYRGSLMNLMTYIRLFTHVFGHLGLEHFIGNAMYLLLIGPMLEEKYGSETVIKVILSTAFVAGIVHCILWNHVSLCGASGVVFAFIVLSSFTTFRDGDIPLSFILVVCLYIGNEVYNGIAIRDNVSNLTHILGGVVGSVYGYLLNKKNI